MRVRTFLVLAFTISWIAGVAANYLLADWVSGSGRAWRQYAPTAVVTWSIGLTALWAAARSSTWRRWRALPGPTPGAFLLLAFLFAPTGVTWLAYSVAGARAKMSVVALVLLVGHLLAQFVIVGIGEELGWRGFVLRRLVATRTLLMATLLTTMVWLLWHLPKLLSPLAVSIPLAVVIVSSSFLISLAWSKTGGSVIAAAALHAGINAPVYWLELSGLVSQPELLRGWQVLSACYAVTAVLALVWFRRSWSHVGVVTSDSRATSDSSSA